jgi:maleylpyruvate isomerase
VPQPQDATNVDSILADVGARTLELVLRARLLTESEVSAPSRLPGWTRGHVLAHLADNADAFAAVLARAGEADDAGLMYVSAESRDRSIEAGALRSSANHLTHLVGSAHRLAAAWRELPADRLGATVSGTAGWTRPVRDVPWMRWRELALHAVDLGWPAGFTPGDPLVERLLDESLQTLAARPGAPALAVTDTDRGVACTVGSSPGPVRVDGSTSELALWVTGRSDGGSLAASGPLPALPPWL